MAGHVRLKNESMEDENYHNLMKWLICVQHELKNTKYMYEHYSCNKLNFRCTSMDKHV